MIAVNGITSPEGILTHKYLRQSDFSKKIIRAVIQQVSTGTTQPPVLSVVLILKLISTGITQLVD